jgi:uncharacterized protein YegP (UPF0339 family)
MQYRIKRSSNQFYFTIVSPRNYQTLATSERYWNKADAISTAKLIAGSGGTVVDET